MDAQSRRREGAVRDTAAQSPAARIGGIDIACGGADDEQGRRGGHTYTRISHFPGERVYFYELSESDDEIFANLLLAHDAEYDEREFLEMVLEAREAVLNSFTEDSLIEGVGAELERRHGFVHVDENLRAAVRVSAEEGETRHHRRRRAGGHRRGRGRRHALDADRGRVRGSPLPRLTLTLSSDVEAHLDAVAILDYVILALRAQLAVLASLGE